MDMKSHKFRVGQKVMFQSSRRALGPAIYVVLRLLPRESQGFSYRIKSRDGNEERVAGELELASLNEGLA